MQADHLTGIYRELAKIPQVKLVYWFCLRDWPKVITGGENSMGLLAADNRRKPSYQAFSELVESGR
jgi:hypothetical protein